MIQQTTALRKIAKLKKRIWVIQGGQGAGKTFSIMILIVQFAAKNPNKEIIIASQELTKMRLTVIKDFVNILRSINYFDPNSFTGGTFYRFRNGSFIKFIGLDKEDIGKGLRSDLVFMNEANKSTFETFRELTSRAKRVIIDFNPNNRFWAHDEVLTREDAEYLILTYLDNEHLSKEEIHEIELNKIQAYIDPYCEDYERPDNIKSLYWRNKWHVYGLGIIGTNPNRIFFWKSISAARFNEIDSEIVYGVDWGAVDPFAIVACKYEDGNLYCHELNYASENQIRERLTLTERSQIDDDNEGLVIWLFSKLGIDTRSTIICDPNRKLKIVALRQMGYDYAIAANKPPGSIKDGIDLLSSLNVFYTNESENLRYESENYSRKIDRYGIVLDEPIDVDNHQMDSIRYVAQFLQMEGIIRIA